MTALSSEAREPRRFRSKNRFDVQIAWGKTGRLRLTSSPTKALTIRDVIDELEWFVKRAKRMERAVKKDEARKLLRARAAEDGQP